MNIINKIKNPHALQLELVEGCNRMCDFCGINSIWKNKKDRNIKFIDPILIEKLSIEFNNWINKGRIELAMHGEPTLHPKLLTIIKLLRKNIPRAQIQLATNGLHLLKYPSILDEMFKYGLNILVVDTYTKRKELLKLCKNNKSAKYFYYYDKNCNYHPYSYNKNGNKIKIILDTDDLSNMLAKKIQRTIENHAGNSNEKNLLKYGILPLRSSLIKKCVRPFRELVFHHDGTIPICCVDWRHEFIIGKFPEDGSLKDIWNSEIFNIARYFLLNKNRIMRPCYKCNFFGGFRQGLLSKIKLNSSKEDAFLKLKIHLKKYKKYEHKNAKNESLFYNNKNIGIRNYI